MLVDVRGGAHGVGCGENQANNAAVEAAGARLARAARSGRWIMTRGVPDRARVVSAVLAGRRSKRAGRQRVIDRDGGALSAGSAGPRSKVGSVDRVRSSTGGAALRHRHVRDLKHGTVVDSNAGFVARSSVAGPTRGGASSARRGGRVRRK